MRARPVARALLAACLLLVSTGCEYFIAGAAAGAIGGVVATRDIRVKPGASVRVDLGQERDVVAIHTARAAGDTVVLRATRTLFGRVQRTAGDSVWVGVSEARGTGSPMRFPAGGAPVVLVRQEPGVRIEPLANRPAYIVAGALAGTGAAFLYLFIYCAFNRCLD